MRDKRHPEDQLFFVAEGDFRFYKEDCVGEFDWIQKLLEIEAEDPLRIHGDEQTHPAFQGTRSTEAAAEPFARSSAEPFARKGVRRDRSVFEHTQEMPTFEGWQPGTRCRVREGHVSEELSDLVRIVTTASRACLGDIVWLSWCGRQFRKLHPSHGSTLLALTRRAAEQLQPLINAAKPKHFDVWLRDLLLHEGWAEELKLAASFVCPSVGSYDEHLSGCDPLNAGEDGIRLSTWDAPWTQPGVRPDKDRKGQDKDRWICKFRKKGPPDYVVKVDFSKERSLCWLTQAPPRHWCTWDHHWWGILQARGWIWNDQLWIPAVATEPFARAGGAHRPPAQYWIDLATRPDGFAWEDDVQAWSPISRIAEVIVVDYDFYDPLSRETTGRMKQTRKKQLAFYKRRIFAHPDSDDVAGAFFHPSQESSPLLPVACLCFQKFLQSSWPGRALKCLSLENLQIPQTLQRTLQSPSLGTSKALGLGPSRGPLAWSSSAQFDTTWYKPVMHSPENNQIPLDAMGTIQIFHPLLLKMLRSMQPGMPAPTATMPIAGRFSGSASSTHR